MSQKRTLKNVLSFLVNKKSFSFFFVFTFSFEMKQGEQTKTKEAKNVYEKK